MAAIPSKLGEGGAGLSPRGNGAVSETVDHWRVGTP